MRYSDLSNTAIANPKRLMSRSGSSPAMKASGLLVANAGLAEATMATSPQLRRIDYRATRAARLKEARCHFGDDFGFGGAKQHCVGPEMWGVSLEQLEQIIDDRRFRMTRTDIYGTVFPGMTMREVVEAIIKPDTLGSGVGYAMLKNQEQLLQARVVVTHAWDVKYQELVDALRGSGEVGPFWVCATGLYQNDDIEDMAISKQLGDDLHTGPVATVLKQADSMICVVSPSMDFCSRMWCLHEISMALMLKVPISVAQEVIYRDSLGYEDTFTLQCEEPVSSKTARCGEASADGAQIKSPDADMFARHIEASAGGYLAIDLAVERARMQALRRLADQVSQRAYHEMPGDIMPGKRQNKAKLFADKCGAAFAQIRQRRVAFVEVFGLDVDVPAVDRAKILSDALRDPDASVRIAACNRLRDLGEVAAENAVPTLIRTLDAADVAANRSSTETKVLIAAADALGMIGPAAHDSIRALKSLAYDPDVGVRRSITTALGAIGEAAKDTAALMVQNLKDPDGVTRCAAAEAIQRCIGAAAAGDTFLKSLQDGTWAKADIEC